MKLNFHNLPWKTTFRFISHGSNVNLFKIGRHCYLLINFKDQTSVLSVDAPFESSFPLTRELIENDGKCRAIVEVSGTIFHVNDSGHFFKLDKIDGDPTRTLAWSKVCDIDEQIVNATGLSDGLAAVARKNNCWILYLYDLIGIELKKYSEYLLCGTNEVCSGCFLKKIPINAQFRKHFFSDLALVFTEVLILNHPNGRVSLLPLITNCPVNLRMCDIGQESSQLVEAFFIADCLILVFQSGKIVMFAYKTKVETVCHFLPTNVSAIVIKENMNDSQLDIVWSDGNELYLSRIINQTDIKFCSVVNSIYGIQHLFKVENEIIGITVNCLFYNIEVSNEENSNSNSDLCDVWMRMIEEPGFSDRLKIADDKLSVLKSAQVSADKIIVSLIADSIFIDNKSDNTFLQTYWSILLAAESDSQTDSEVFSLEKDFTPNSSISLPVNDFLSDKCRKLDIGLVGNIVDDDRNFYVFLKTINLAENI